LVDSTLRLFTSVPSPIAEDCLLRLLAAATDDSERRIRIVLALASMGSPAVETYIASQLDGTAASLRERCIAYGTLGWLEAARATPIVLEQLPAETDPHVIACGIESLGELAGDSAEAFLLRALDPAQWPPAWPQRQPPPQQGDQRPSDRRCLAAVIALNRIGSVAALPELERMAQDPDEAPEVRQAAFIAARTIAWNANSQGVTPVVRPRPSVI
jgi:HEAT repeat protein